MKENPNRDLTFEQFSSRLDGMAERCSSCKYFERGKNSDGQGLCTKHNEQRAYSDPKCDKWRYAF